MDRKTLIVIVAHIDHENRDGVNNVIKTIEENTPRKLYELDIEWNRGEGIVIPSNRGHRKAQALGYDLICLGDDIYWEDSQWLQKMKKLAYSSKEIGMVNTTIVNRNFTNKDKTSKQYRLGLGLSFKKNNILNKIGILDENYITCGDEIDYSIRLAKHNLKIVEISIHEYENQNIETTQNKVFGRDKIKELQKEAIKYRNLKWGFIDEH